MEKFIEESQIFEDNGVIRSALEYMPVGEVWSLENIELRRESLLSEGREWAVVDNLVIHDEIKIGGASASGFIDSYKETLTNLARAGINTVRYNFVPVFHKLSTHQDFSLSQKYPIAIFDIIAFAVFDIYILERNDIGSCYNDYQKHAARLFNRRLSFLERKQLEVNILSCVQDERLTDLDSLLNTVNRYRKISDEKLSQNLFDFERSVLPLAKKLGIKMHFETEIPPAQVFEMPKII